MLLTPEIAERLDAVLAVFATSLSDPLARVALARISASVAAADDAESGRLEAAVELARSFGMRPLAEPPASFLSWDGERVRTVTEPAVLIHEVAHFQLASRARRRLPDFGLGAGPESGAVAVAERARALGAASREIEEQMASLLGILWETELGHRAIDAFVEQNWLEGAGRPSAAEFFAVTLLRLRYAGMIDDTARPCRAVNTRADDAPAADGSSLAFSA